MKPETLRTLIEIGRGLIDFGALLVILYVKKTIAELKLAMEMRNSALLAQVDEKYSRKELCTEQHRELSERLARAGA